MSSGRGCARVALVALVCSCGPASPAPIALEEFGAAMRSAVCDWAVRCRHVPNQALCSDLQDPKDFDVRRAVDAVAAGRLVYDDELAGMCVADTASQACLAQPFSAQPCLRMFRGLVAAGQACSSSFECTAGASCENQRCGAQCCVGVCGEPVDDVEPPRRHEIGARCSSHPDCVLTAYCDRGRCTGLPEQPGEPCTFGCAWGDLYCDLDDLVCKRFGAEGESCDPAGAIAPPCDPAWSYCDGVCTRRPGAGQGCNLDERRCVAAARCVVDTCVARGGAGDPCSEADDCAVACDEVAGLCVDYRSCDLSDPP